MCEIHSYWEHCDEEVNLQEFTDLPFSITFSKDIEEKRYCIHLFKKEEKIFLQSSYFIGLDWIDENNAIYIAPKLNKDEYQIDFLKMLFNCLKHPEIFPHTQNLFEIKFDKPSIEIEQKNDLITPLLIVQYLQVVRSIVRKGLKKSYYPVKRNLTAKIKGKVLVSNTIKNNIVKNQPLKTVCRFDEFGLNGLENRLLKKALLFAQKYLASTSTFLENLRLVLDYCLSAFENIDETIEVNEIRYSKPNAFFKEYEEGTRLAKLILKRFYYNINNVTSKQKSKVPPFWIDMSKLFELYVLGKLKDRFGNQVKYHFTAYKYELDYLLNSPGYKMVIDAKYKPQYDYKLVIEDIRQLSAYSRMKKVVQDLNMDENEVVDCLIIYPNQNIQVFEELPEELTEISIPSFIKFFKLPIRLPEIRS